MSKPHTYELHVDTARRRPVKVYLYDRTELVRVSLAWDMEEAHAIGEAWESVGNHPRADRALEDLYADVRSA